MSGQQVLKQVISDFDYSEELTKAYALAELTLDQLKMPQLISTINFEFNNHFINIAGDAKLVRNLVGSYYKIHKDIKLGLGATVDNYHYSGKIRLSSKYFAVSAEEDKIETVVHEVCHIANTYLRYTNIDWKTNDYNCMPTKHHGFGWQTIMNKAGYKNPEPCHILDTSQFKTFYKFKCEHCGFDKGRLTAQMGGRIINQTTYRQCTSCNLVIGKRSLTKVNGADLIYKE